MIYYIRIMYIRTYIDDLKFRHKQKKHDDTLACNRKLVSSKLFLSPNHNLRIQSA
jgi:hypothetical protein